jgi:hypothetical protein
MIFAQRLRSTPCSNQPSFQGMLMRTSSPFLFLMGRQSICGTQEYLRLAGELFQGMLEKMESCTSFISDIFEEKAGEWHDE